MLKSDLWQQKDLAEDNLPRINFMDRNRFIEVFSYETYCTCCSRPKQLCNKYSSLIPRPFSRLGMRLLTSNIHHLISNLSCRYTQIKVSLFSHLFLDGHHHAVQLWQQCVGMEHGQPPDRQQPFTLSTPVLVGDILHRLT